MDYLELLENSYRVAVESDECPPSRLAFLGEQIFDFTTYDSGISELFAKKAIEVCDSINKRTTFDYIKDQENYIWFLLMCNMPFFACRLEWGASIRGAWWDAGRLESCGLYSGDDQILSIEFTYEEWTRFAEALVVFALKEDAEEGS